MLIGSRIDFSGQPAAFTAGDRCGVDVSGRLFHDHAPRCRRGRRRRRDHECDPRIPAIGPVLRGKFLVAFEIEVALHLADGKNESELRADTDHLRLEAPHAIAGAAVATDFFVKISDQSDLKLLGQEL